MDMKDQLLDKISVDEYAAKTGKDKDVVTVTFNVKSELAADDLVYWFEKGYNFILDADVSAGKVKGGRYLVFVEMERDSNVAKNIVTLLGDLETLTGLTIDDWTVLVDGKSHAADKEALREVIISDPAEYEMAHPEPVEEPEEPEEPEVAPEENPDEEAEESLNEFRALAGLDRKKKVYKEDEYIKNLKAIAGL